MSVSRLEISIVLFVDGSKSATRIDLWNETAVDVTAHENPIHLTSPLTFSAGSIVRVAEMLCATIFPITGVVDGAVSRVTISILEDLP